jgi:hypothetical protein
MIIKTFKKKTLVAENKQGHASCVFRVHRMDRAAVGHGCLSVHRKLLDEVLGIKQITVDLTRSIHV